MIELKDGEVICDKCKGNGIIKYTDEKFFIQRTSCPKCDGVGKLDWIENITGKKDPQPWFHGQSGYPKRYERWGITSELSNNIFKMSSEEIKQSLNSNYTKQLKRKNAYNVTKNSGGNF